MEEANRKYMETNEKMQSAMSKLQEGTMRGDVKGPGFFSKLGAVFDHAVDKAGTTFDSVVDGFKSFFN